MNSSIKYPILIVFFSALLFIPFLGNVHLFDWDEINFAECAREMLVSGNYFSVQINFQPFWEKPPLFIWMQALSMNFFGVNEFAARLPNAICGILSLLSLFLIGKKVYNPTFGLWWVLVYAGSLLPHFYFKSGIIDPWFNLFIFTSIYFFIVFIDSKKQKDLFLSAILLGLAVLTKGPVALLIVGLCFIIYWTYTRFSAIIKIHQVILYALTTLLIGGAWFWLLIINGKSNIIYDFFEYQIRLFQTQDSGHGGPFFYHWIVLLIGCFPMSIIALKAFVYKGNEIGIQKSFKVFMFILFWVVLILFSIVKTKIVHYSSLCYFPLSYISSYVIYQLLKSNLSWKKGYSILLISIAGVIGIALFLLPFVDKYKNVIVDSGIIKDSFAVENLKANVYWSGYEWMIGVCFIASIATATIMINRNQMQKGLIILFTGTLITINSALIVIVPRIEQYSQRAAILFYKSIANKNCYVETYGFKSYANLFYFQKQIPHHPNSYDMNWYLNGDTDKPTYFVGKIQHTEQISNQYPHLKEIYRRNGFVFYIKNKALLQ
jgi:4-amino-4-deoxy-L-arabinose transferase-like glycosyltransferase